ncbi:MAG TPA: phage/plasmid replication protein, II/X family [Rhodocyclaceae bacterium]|nr:phage/plasmid replication protein, II/X family [Rhodocyclaceae bacterium]
MKLRPPHDPFVDIACPIGLDVFCDWITIYQDHMQADLKPLHDGYVVRFEPEAFRKSIDLETGEIRPMFDATKAEYTAVRRMEHVGSYDTKISVRCDGRRVELSGNVGRFGRPDNLFGVKVLETIERANEILAALGLPPFTGHDRTIGHAHSQGFLKSHNAVITRVDLTANFSTGSRDAAFRVLHWMCGQGTCRNSGKNPRFYGNGVTWNEGSKRWYAKLYFKADELGQHVSDAVRQYCADRGILRYEVSLKARELADMGLQSMAGWSQVVEGQRMENVIYGKFAQVLTRNQVTVTEIQDIPKKLGLIARSYLNGENPYQTLEASLRTKQRWRSQLLKYGLDIAQPIDVTRLTQRVRLIELQPVVAPNWYERTAA